METNVKVVGASLLTIDPDYQLDKSENSSESSGPQGSHLTVVASDAQIVLEI